jgi:hypothetical protein
MTAVATAALTKAASAVRANRTAAMNTGRTAEKKLLFTKLFLTNDKQPQERRRRLLWRLLPRKSRK